MHDTQIFYNPISTIEDRKIKTGTKILLIGLEYTLEIRYSKQRTMFAIVEFSDLHGAIELLLFKKEHIQYLANRNSNTLLLVSGTINDDCKTIEVVKFMDIESYQNTKNIIIQNKEIIDFYNNIGIYFTIEKYKNKIDILENATSCYFEKTNENSLQLVIQGNSSTLILNSTELDTEFH